MTIHINARDEIFPFVLGYLSECDERCVLLWLRLLGYYIISTSPFTRPWYQRQWLPQEQITALSKFWGDYGMPSPHLFRNIEDESVEYIKRNVEIRPYTWVSYQ